MNQTRSFCFVADTVDAPIHLMKHPSVIDPMNVGCDAEINMFELASIILRLTASKSQIRHKPLPQDDPCRREPDISRAGAALRWEPETALVDGLRATIGYFRELMELERPTRRFVADEPRPRDMVAIGAPHITLKQAAIQL